MKNIKKYAVLTVCLILISTLFCGCVARKVQNEGYLLYRSSPVGVQIEYPDFWEMAEDKTERTVAFATPSEGYADTYRDNVSIVSYELDKDNEMAFDQYVRQYIDTLDKTINDYLFISENDVKVGNYEAYQVVYEGKTSDGALRLQQTFIKSGNYIYIVSFIAEPASYDYFNGNAQVMLSTFKALRS